MMVTLKETLDAINKMSSDIDELKGDINNISEKISYEINFLHNIRDINHSPTYSDFINNAYEKSKEIINKLNEAMEIYYSFVSLSEKCITHLKHASDNYIENSNHNIENMRSNEELLGKDYTESRIKVIRNLCEQVELASPSYNAAVKVEEYHAIKIIYLYYANLLQALTMYDPNRKYDVLNKTLNLINDLPLPIWSEISMLMNIARDLAEIVNCFDEFYRREKIYSQDSGVIQKYDSQKEYLEKIYSLLPNFLNTLNELKNKYDVL